MTDANNSFSGTFDWLRVLLYGRPKGPAVERRGAVRKQVLVRAEIQTMGRALRVNCIDFNRFGAKVISKLGWATGTALFIRFGEYRLMGFAYVRHCTLQEDSTYALGLEFRAPLMRQDSGEWQIERVCLSKEIGTQDQEVAAGHGFSPEIQ